jgi:hypothetical protein
MPLTHHQHGIASYGIPVLPGNLPFGNDSKVFFVAPWRTTDNGATNGNDGLDPGRAKKTVFGTDGAFASCRDNKNDTIVMMASGDSAAETTEDISVEATWNKDLVHLIGQSRNKYGQRCRFNNSGTGVTPMITISGSGCVFANFQAFCGGDSGNLVDIEMTGNHNYMENVHIAGMGDATAADTASATSLKLNGGTENVFKNCIIGLDTVERDADSKGELWFDGGASRMWFEDCLFTTYLSADNQTVTVEDGTAIDRTITFKNCLFFSKSTNKAVAQTTVFSIPAGISQGAILLIDSYAGSDGGAAEWDSGDRGIIWTNSVAAAASAAGGILTNQ